MVTFSYGSTVSLLLYVFYVRYYHDSTISGVKKGNSITTESLQDGM